MNDGDLTKYIIDRLDEQRDAIEELRLSVNELKSDVEDLQKTWTTIKRVVYAIATMLAGVLGVNLNTFLH